MSWIVDGLGLIDRPVTPAALMAVMVPVALVAAVVLASVPVWLLTHRWPPAVRRTQ